MSSRQSGDSTANTDVRSVSGYPDLVLDPDLDITEVDAIARAFNDGFSLVIWAPEWVLRDSVLLGGHDQLTVITGQIESESEKAFLVSDNGLEGWLPKSQIILYEREPGADIYDPPAPWKRADADIGASQIETETEMEER